MRLGCISLWGDDLGAFKRQIRLAEELGYDAIGIGESPSAWQDMCVTLALAAQETERATLVTTVTTPFLRHPVVLARAMLSVSDLADGRVTIAIGSGGSAVGAIGRGPSTMRQLREYVLAVRVLLNGESVTWDGHRTEPLVRAHPMPIYIPADGPNSLRLAAEIADGVIINAGMAMPFVDQRVDAIRAATKDAGRNPDEIAIWCYSYVSLRDTSEAAIADITAFLAVRGGLWMQKPYARALVPPELEEAVERMVREYTTTEHTVVGSRQAELVAGLGLADWLAGLTALAGTPGDVAAGVQRLEERGVSLVFAALPGNADPEGTLRRFRDAVPG